MPSMKTLEAKRMEFAKYYTYVLGNLRDLFHQGGQSSFAALDQLDQEWQQILTLFTWMQEHASDSDEAVLTLCVSITGIASEILAFRMRPEEQIQLSLIALRSASLLNNKDLVASIHTDLGNSYNQVGQASEAIKHYLEAYNHVKGLGSEIEVVGLLNIGNGYDTLGEKELSLEYFLRAYEVTKKIDDPVLVGRALGSVGMSYVMNDQCSAAIDCLEHALNFLSSSGDIKAEASVLGNLANAHRSVSQGVSQ